jgi:hypothetical protein
MNILKVVKENPNVPADSTEYMRIVVASVRMMVPSMQTMVAFMW